MNLIEPDIEEIGRIVKKYDDPSSVAWQRYPVSHSMLTLKFWDSHFEWGFVVGRYSPCEILDYGCGTGHADVYLADVGFRVVAYECNQTDFEVAQYIASIQSEPIRDNIIVVDTPPDSGIDLVWTCHVLEHVPREEWGKFFGPIARLGKPLLVSVPIDRGYYVATHINFWASAKELSDDLAKFGFIERWSLEPDDHTIKAEYIHV